MAEQLYNSLVSYINQTAGMEATDTTVQLLDTSLFPSVCPYRVSIDDEICLVTANTGGLLTVTRGQEGTTATAHAYKTGVFLVVTAGGLVAYVAANGGGGGPTLHGWRLNNTSNITINSAGFTQQTWNNPWIDTSSFHSTTVNPGLITIPTGLGGDYLVGCCLNLESSAAQLIECRMRKNSSVYLNRQWILPAAVAQFTYFWSDLFQLNAGDTLDVIFQVGSGSGTSSGVSSDTPYFWGQKIG